MRKYFFLIFLLLSMHLIIADQDVYVACGGDEDVVIGCMPDSDFFFLGNLPDTTAPIISSISSSVTSSTATITWTTDENSNSTVYYGTTPLTTSSETSSALTMSHSLTLSGLSSSTLYYYNVSSCDTSDNCNISSQYNLTTSASTPPAGGSPGGNLQPVENVTGKGETICALVYDFIIEHYNSGIINYTTEQLNELTEQINIKTGSYLSTTTIASYINDYNSKCRQYKELPASIQFGLAVEAIKSGETKKIFSYYKYEFIFFSVILVGLFSFRYFKKKKRKEKKK